MFRIFLLLSQEHAENGSDERIVGTITKNFREMHELYVHTIGPVVSATLRVPVINLSDNEHVLTYVRSAVESCIGRMRSYCRDPIRVSRRVRCIRVCERSRTKVPQNGIYRKVIINKRAAASRFMIRSANAYAILPVLAPRESTVGIDSVHCVLATHRRKGLSNSVLHRAN